MTITNDQMTKILGNKPQLVNDVVPNLNISLNKYQINTNLRVSHFLAQILHESAGFLYIKENLNYSADGLLKIFPRYFPTLEIANQYARNPEKIANKVYGSRMGNGNEISGEGFKYSGKGYIQITGKNNYKLITEDLKVDFINNPKLLETPKYALESACWFWNKNNLNAFADLDDIDTITRRINGGTLGLLDRKAWLTKCKTVFV
jgi:putative chitinase